MVLLSAVRDYLSRMLSEVPGMKALIVDKHTLVYVSLVLSQSDILHKEVYLVEGVDASSTEIMSHLKAVCFLRPTGESVGLLKLHLAHPRFKEYHLFFSNVLSNSMIQILADADEGEVVRQVQEYYGDFVALDAFHLTVDIPRNYMAYLPLGGSGGTGGERIVSRSVEALTAVFLALKRRPVIRYQRSSEIAKRVAVQAGKVMYEQEKPLFDFRRTEVAPLLLVIDRRDDAVTPLLNQWTYQAMVHELLRIRNNRVDLHHAPNVPEDQKEVVLSESQDEFFRANMYENFGDVGANIARRVDLLQQTDRRNKSLQSLEEMQAVLEAYPAYRQQAGNVSKHVTLMTELQRQVDARQLMSLSQTEQELACSAAQAVAFEMVMAQLANDRVADEDRLRLVMLYALRYEKESPRALQLLVEELSSRPSKLPASLVSTLLKQCGTERRTGDLFGNRDIFNIVARNVKRGLKGVENVYTQHQPLLSVTMEAAAKGRLRDLDYPFVGAHFQQGRPTELVIFIVGGTTYEEARAVALYNAANPGTRIILGGTALLNSTSFMSDLWEVQRAEASDELDMLT